MKSVQIIGTYGFAVSLLRRRSKRILSGIKFAAFQNKMSKREAAPKQPEAQAALKNISSISQLEQQALQTRSLAESISDALTKAVGSFPSIVLHAGFFLAWIVINLEWVPVVPPFDPFPFPFLTLVVSLEAILLSTFLLISANRQGRLDGARQPVRSAD